MTDRRTFRTLVEAKEILVLPGVFNGYSVRLVERIGYGNALNVHFVTRAFERAGLAAISIEDQVWPKRCGHLAGKAVIPAREMADKVKAAVDARHDADFMIRARTDAAATDGINEVI